MEQILTKYLENQRVAAIRDGTEVFARIYGECASLRKPKFGKEAVGSWETVDAEVHLKYKTMPSTASCEQGFTGHWASITFRATNAVE